MKFAKLSLDVSLLPLISQGHEAPCVANAVWVVRPERTCPEWPFCVSEDAKSPQKKLFRRTKSIKFSVCCGEMDVSGPAGEVIVGFFRLDACRGSQ